MLNKIKNILFLFYKFLFGLMGNLLRKNEQMIMFESFLGKQYSDNPRAIYEYLKIHYPNFKMYWSIERKSVEKFKQFNLKYVKRFSLKWLFLMNRSKFWVSNSRLPIWIPKPRSTVYIQTWHGTPLKKLAADMDEVHMPGTNTEQYKNNFLMETSKWDFLISPNYYSTEIFKKAFQFDKQIIESGYPRNDYLINHNNSVEISKVKKKIGIPNDKKVILYAPTWRDNQYYGRGRYKFDLHLDLKLLQNHLANEYVIVLRLHYLIAEELDLTAYKGFVIDASYHEDIRELYLISDMLITDYSSVLFDYANMKRPMLFYVYDIEEYRDKLRGFYLDFEKEAPGPLVRTTEELLKEINKIKKENKNLEEFHEKFCSLEDGNASKRVAQLFVKKN